MHDTIVAINVTEEAGYARYRAAMTPVLTQYGGRFAHDFRVVETLTTDAPHPVTRVFTLRLPDPESTDAFFADPAYQAAKAAHYDQAVEGFTILASQITGET
ncbi:MAG: DUF1330 domain-containing protein [Pseudomonadota bacterium]